MHIFQIKSKPYFQDHSASYIPSFQLPRRSGRSRTRKQGDEDIIEESPSELSAEGDVDRSNAPAPVVSKHIARSERSLRSRSRLTDVAVEVSTTDKETPQENQSPDSNYLFSDSFYRDPSPHRSVITARRAKVARNSELEEESFETVPSVASVVSSRQAVVSQSSSAQSSLVKPITKESKPWKFREVVGVIASYFIISLLMVFLNKELFNRDDVHNALFVTWFQVLISAVLTVFLSYFAIAFPEGSTMRTLFPPISPSLPIFCRALPLGAVFALLLVLNNACLLFVHVSFYQVARSWTIIFNIILSKTVFSTPISTFQIVCAAIVVLGYTIACDGELSIPLLFEQIVSTYKNCVLTHVSTVFSCIWSFIPVSVSAISTLLASLPLVGSAIPKSALSASVSDFVTTLPLNGTIQSTLLALLGELPASSEPCTVSPLLFGLLYGAAGSLILSVYSIMTRQAKQSLPISNTQLVGYTNVTAAVILFVYMVITGDWSRTVAGPAVRSDEFWFALLVVSFAGYLINVVTFFQIEATSPLAHNMIGTAKATVQSVLGWYIYKNPISFRTAIGSAITIFGCAAYAYYTNKPSTSTNKGQSQSPQVESVGAASTSTTEASDVKIPTSQRLGRKAPTSTRDRARSVSRSRIDFSPSRAVLHDEGSKKSVSPVPAVSSWRSEFQRSARKSISRPYFSATTTPVTTSAVPAFDSTSKETITHTAAPASVVVKSIQDENGVVTYPCWAKCIGKMVYQFLTRPPTEEDDE